MIKELYNVYLQQTMSENKSCFIILVLTRTVGLLTTNIVSKSIKISSEIRKAGCTVIKVGFLVLPTHRKLMNISCRLKYLNNYHQVFNNLTLAKVDFKESHNVKIRDALTPFYFPLNHGKKLLPKERCGELLPFDEKDLTLMTGLEGC